MKLIYWKFEHVNKLFFLNFLKYFFKNWSVLHYVKLLSEMDAQMLCYPYMNYESNL